MASGPLVRSSYHAHEHVPTDDDSKSNARDDDGEAISSGGSEFCQFLDRQIDPLDHLGATEVLLDVVHRDRGHEPLPGTFEVLRRQAWPQPLPVA